LEGRKAALTGMEKLGRRISGRIKNGELLEKKELCFWWVIAENTHVASPADRHPYESCAPLWIRMKTSKFLSWTEAVTWGKVTERGNGGKSGGALVKEEEGGLRQRGL
jgi:hypothetical protein